MQYVQEHKTQYKWLAGVRFVDAVPKNPSGKLLRRLLRDELKVLMQEGKMEIPEHAYSLYGCVAGMVCAWAEVYTRLTGHAKDGIAHGNGHAPGDGGAGAGDAHPPQRRGGMPGDDDLAMFE